jgi:hypothetical protein
MAATSQPRGTSSIKFRRDFDEDPITSRPTIRWQSNRQTATCVTRAHALQQSAARPIARAAWIPAAISFAVAWGADQLKKL